MVLLCREVGVWCGTGYSSMGPLCGLRLGQNASLTLNNNNNIAQHAISLKRLLYQGKANLTPEEVVSVTPRQVLYFFGSLELP